MYNSLHESVHARNTHVKIHHSASKSASAFAWVSPTFEFYCVAGPDANRNALSQSSNKIIQWIRKEEERLFIIGGAVSYVCLSIIEFVANFSARSSRDILVDIIRL